MSAVVEEATPAERAATTPVLVVEHLVKNFNVRTTKGVRTVKGTVQAVVRRVVRDRCGRDARARGRVRLGEVDGRPLRAAS